MTLPNMVAEKGQLIHNGQVIADADFELNWRQEQPHGWRGNMTNVRPRIPDEDFRHIILHGDKSQLKIDLPSCSGEITPVEWTLDNIEGELYNDLGFDSRQLHEKGDSDSDQGSVNEEVDAQE